MYFQIKKIILWPRKKHLRQRELTFEQGKLNVISGASRTGKSAIIPIVDYCLGASDCFIPVDTIRNACEWFGILVQLENKQILLARREPGKQNVSGDMFSLQGEKVEIPPLISGKNIFSGDVKKLLDDIACIPQFRLDGDDARGEGFKDRPSFRDLLAFNFQPQNIIANQNILFYKADTYKHREKLINVFPYALGALTQEILAMRYELHYLQSELKRKERELQKVKNVSIRWISEMRSHISTAKEFGLLEDIEINSESKEDLMGHLKSLTKKTDVKPNISESSISTALTELNQIRNEENDRSLELSNLRLRLKEMDRLRDTTSQYHEMTNLKRDRLKISDWIAKPRDSHSECPVCGGNLESAHIELSNLQKSLRGFENEAQAYIEMPAAFQREYENVRLEIRKASEELNALQNRREKLEVSSAKLKQEHYRYDNALRFIGKVEQAIETYERIGDDGELVNEIDELRSRITELQSKISEEKIQHRIDRALDQISSFINNTLPKLDVEELYKTAPCKVIIKDLAIQIAAENGQSHYLWEIGSGSNWVSYHIAVIIAFQKLFSLHKHSPIPGFVIFDQPSQVYFPKRLADKSSEEGYDPEFDDEDVKAVHKLFSTLSAAIMDMSGRCQAIVLDHASETVWGGIPGIFKVDEWRGKKLIPQEWL